MLEYIDAYTKARLAECQTRTEELNVLAFMRLEQKERKQNMPPATKQDMYNYLERLRESGRTNMFGASPYLRDQFGLTIDEAKNVLKDWMGERGGGSTIGVDGCSHE